MAVISVFAVKTSSSQSQFQFIEAGLNYEILLDLVHLFPIGVINWAIFIVKIKLVMFDYLQIFNVSSILI